MTAFLRILAACVLLALAGTAAAQGRLTSDDTVYPFWDSMASEAEERLASGEAVLTNWKICAGGLRRFVKSFHRDASKTTHGSQRWSNRSQHSDRSRKTGRKPKILLRDATS